MQSVNIEKLGIYVAILSIGVMFWQNSINTQWSIIDMKERIAKLEIKVENLEK